jgi:hypothetical protein
VETPTSAPKATPSNKPPEPPKEGGKQTVTINGIVWIWCQTYFHGPGTWNRTHCTAQYTVGAGRGPAAKGNTPSNKATANLVAQNDNKDAAFGGVCFSLRLELLVMLALCLLLTFFQAITLNDRTLLSTSFIYFWSPSQTTVHERRCQRSRHYYSTLPLQFCSKKEDGALPG